VGLRADDTIAPMSIVAPSSRTSALKTWVENVLRARGERVLGAWREVPGDASFRRFHRVHTNTGSLVAMDAPPATENNDQFVRLATLFHAAGVCVPRVIAYEPAQGFVLVSDLGEQLYAQVYDTPARDDAIEAALQTLLRIQAVADPDRIIPAYTRQRLHDELQLFRVWLVEALLAQPLTTAERGMLDDIWTVLIENADRQPKVVVHRDYHCRNLLWGSDRITCVVDFQDALRGPLLYDLASLLRDCYVRFTEAEIARWSARYRGLAADAGWINVPADPLEFVRALDLTAVQRQLKALGLFTRLALRDSRPSHLVDIAPVLEALIDVTRRYTDLADFSEWLALSIQAPTLAALARLDVTPCGQ
jgi:aminoglycoside/choline kinase family phosphotransferase